jgi:FkbH-like protein
VKQEKQNIKLKLIKKDIQKGHFTEAFKDLVALSEQEHDFTLQSRYAALYNSIPSEKLELKDLRLALLATSTVDHFIDILKFWLAKQGFRVEIFSSPFNTIHQTVLDPTSDFYNFAPEFVWIFNNYRDVKLSVPFGASPNECDAAIDIILKEFVELWDVIQKQSSCHILQNNFDLPNYRVFGNLEGSVGWSQINLLRKLNLSLALSSRPGVTIFDMDYLSSLFGKNNWHDARYWHYSKHAFSFDASGLVASQAGSIIVAGKGSAKKCLILDLDNTLWGGVIGDDGISGIQLGHGAEGEAFLEFQKYLLALKKRGILLSICSKNEEDIARDVFLNHPNMLIQLDDIAMFKANWKNKPDNIRDIAATLNIGLDSLVFIDDNPFERQLVQKILPEVTVIDLPEDPTLFIGAIERGAFFESLAFSNEDSNRNELYKQNTIRSEHQKQFVNLNEFLSDLNMESEVGQVNEQNLSRFAQLINKSNQFHLTTTRYTEAEVKSMINDKMTIVRYFCLKDRFGDNGLISALIIKLQPELFYIDTWVMSCRVFSRGMEEFICSEIISMAKWAKTKFIRGKYIPSKKNKLVSSLYGRLGFKLAKTEADGTLYWELDMKESLPKFIHTIKRAESKNLSPENLR